MDSEAERSDNDFEVMEILGQVETQQKSSKMDSERSTENIAEDTAENYATDSKTVEIELEKKVSKIILVIHFKN